MDRAIVRCTGCGLPMSSLDPSVKEIWCPICTAAWMQGLYPADPQIGPIEAVNGSGGGNVPDPAQNPVHVTGSGNGRLLNNVPATDLSFEDVLAKESAGNAVYDNNIAVASNTLQQALDETGVNVLDEFPGQRCSRCGSALPARRCREDDLCTDCGRIADEMRPSVARVSEAIKNDSGFSF